MMDRREETSYSLAVLSSHPIQYFAPLYRRLAQEPEIDLMVYYFSRAGLDAYEDRGFGGETLAWDIPLVEGYDHVFVRNLRGERSPSGFWSLVNPGIVTALRRERYDAVWIHGHAYASYLLGVLGARMAGSALFMRCDTHLGLDRGPIRRTLRGPVMTTFYRVFDAFLAIGTRNAEFYRRHGVTDQKIFLVPYAVDNRRFEAGSRLTEGRRARIRYDLGLPPPEVPVVLFLSKLIRRKRPMDVLRAFRRVRRGGALGALAFVGAGEEMGRLKDYVARHEVGGVHFLGFRNQSELPSIYGVSDVFVLSSENEPWGLVVNEAMCAGLPVVVADEVGAAEDLVRHGQNGFQYPAGDVATLADRLARLLASKQLRHRMSCASRRVVDGWNLAASVDGVKRAVRATCRTRATRAIKQRTPRTRRHT